MFLYSVLLGDRPDVLMAQNPRLLRLLQTALASRSHILLRPLTSPGRQQAVGHVDFQQLSALDMHRDCAKTFSLMGFSWRIELQPKIPAGRNAAGHAFLS